MEVLYKRYCGIDVHKNMLVACVFTSVRKKRDPPVFNNDGRYSPISFMAERNGFVRWLP